MVKTWILKKSTPSRKKKISIFFIAMTYGSLFIYLFLGAHLTRWVFPAWQLSFHSFLSPSRRKYKRMGEKLLQALFSLRLILGVVETVLRLIDGMSDLERAVAVRHQVFAILSWIISASSVVLQLFNFLCVLVTCVVVIWRTISYTVLIHSSH